MVRQCILVGLLAVGVVPSMGCGGDDSGDAAVGSSTSGSPDGGAPCAPDEFPVDGGCQAPGIAPEACGQGFVPSDGGGCAALLPDGPCPDGQMAIPGETECRPVAPCGDGTWGDIPVDATTQFVDGSYTGADSDGSSQKPWTTIGDAVSAAAPGAIVAVAEGAYTEDVEIAQSPVLLWGRCPSLVEVSGTGTEVATILVINGADGTMVRGLAVGGPTPGIVVSGSEDVVLEAVWVHDTDRPGIGADDTLGSTSIVCRGALVEEANEIGLLVRGAVATIQGSVIRDAVEVDGSAKGISLSVDLDTMRRSSATVRASLVESNPGVGVNVIGSDLVLEASVVRDTRPLDAVIDERQGRGIHVQYVPDTGERASAVVRASVVERNHEVGVVAIGSDATLENTVVSDTKPQPNTGERGRGVSAEGSLTGDPARLTLLSTVLERNQDAALVVRGSEATIEGSIVRATKPRASDQRYGGGINIESDPDAGHPSVATIRTTLVEDNFSFGIFVLDSDATLGPVRVRGTGAEVAGGIYGDGIAVASQLSPATATISGSFVETSARAGVSVFGAKATLDSSHLECNAVHLDGEELMGVGYVLQDLGGNSCGCNGSAAECTVQSASLAPPEALSQ